MAKTKLEKLLHSSTTMVEYVTLQDALRMYIKIREEHREHSPMELMKLEIAHHLLKEHK